MIRFVMLFAGILCCTSAVSAQNRAIIFSILGKRVQAIYHVGDEIGLKSNESGQKLKKEIMAITDSSVVFRNAEVLIEEVSHIFVDGKIGSWYMLKYKYDRIFALAGGAFLLLDVANTGDLSSDAVLVTGSLFGAALLSRLLMPRWIRINHRRKVRIVELP